MSQLPHQWKNIRLAEVCEVNPRDPGPTPPSTPVSFIPMPAVSDIEGVIMRHETKPFTAVAKGYTRFREQDVIFAKITPCMENGKIAVAAGLHGGFACGSTEFHVLRSSKAILPSYLWRFLRQDSFRQDAERHMTGAVGQRRVPAQYIKDALIPLPPVPEQRRIIAKLDNLFRHSKSAREELARIPRLVERYKQAILAAAFRGDLTAKWREAELHGSTGASLQRQLCEAHTQNGGHKRGNAAPPTEGAHTLTRQDFPDTWGLAELRDLVDPLAPITYGILKPGPDCDGGVPYVRVADFPNDTLNVNRLRRTSKKIDEDFKRSRLKAGDILLSIRGTVGRVCSIPQALSGANITQDSARVRVQEGLRPAYIEWMLRSPAVQRAMQVSVKGVAVRGINIGDVRALQIPIPSSEEQLEIVHRIETAFDRINKLSKAETARAATLLDRLEEATLAKAFRGELIKLASDIDSVRSKPAPSAL